MTVNLHHLSEQYESYSSTVNNGSTDWDLKAQETAFDKSTVYSLVKVRTDQTISVKFNSTGNDSITITSTESPKEFNLPVRNVYVSNASGSNATVQIELYLV